VGHPPKGDNFFSDYSNWHAGAFAQTPGGKANGLQVTKGCTVETLVSTLADLQFTVKGKVGEDGKFELMFCSPDPVVTQEVTRSEPPAPIVEVGTEVPPKPVMEREVRFIEAPRRREHSRERSHRRRKNRGLLWN